MIHSKQISFITNQKSFFCRLSFITHLKKGGYFESEKVINNVISYELYYFSFIVMQYEKNKAEEELLILLQEKM